MAKGLLGPEQDAALWSRVIQFDEGLTPTAARALLKIRFSQADQRRLSELAEKARRGTLSGDEEHLAGAYERLGCVLDILHSKARQALKQRLAGSPSVPNHEKSHRSPRKRNSNQH